MTLVKTNKGLRANGGLRRRGLFPTTNLFPTTSLFDNFADFGFPELDIWDSGQSMVMPSANVMQDDKKFIIEMSVPGYAKKDIHVEIDDNNVLCISADRKEERKEESENYTRKEFSYGSFNRSFELPDSIKEDKISAKCTDGILTVELPKKEGAVLRSKAKEIKIA